MVKMSNFNKPASPTPNEDGLTKLELVAAMAMQGMLSTERNFDRRYVAEQAVDFAKALLDRVKEVS
jgi:hypothetical protein